MHFSFFQIEIESLKTRIDQLTHQLEEERKTSAAVREVDKSKIKRHVDEHQSVAQGDKMLRETVDHLQTAFDEAIKGIMDYKRDISILRKELEDKEKMFQLQDKQILHKDIFIQKLLKSCASEKEDLKKEKLFRDKIQDQNEKVQDLENSNCLKKNRIRTLERDILSKESEMQNILVANSKTIEKYQSKQEQLVIDIDRKDKLIQEMNQKIQKMETLECSNAEKIETLEKSILTKDSEIQRILHAHSRTQGEEKSKLEELLCKIQTMDKEIRDSNKKCQNLEICYAEKIQTLEKSVTDKETKMEELLSSLCKEKAEHQSRVSNLETEINCKNRAAEDCCSKLKSLESEIVLKDNTIKRLSEVEVAVKATNTDNSNTDDCTSEAKRTVLQVELSQCKERIQVLTNFVSGRISSGGHS